MNLMSSLATQLALGHRIPSFSENKPYYAHFCIYCFSSYQNLFLCGKKALFLINFQLPHSCVLKFTIPSTKLFSTSVFIITLKASLVMNCIIYHFHLFFSVSVSPISLWIIWTKVLRVPYHICMFQGKGSWKSCWMNGLNNIYYKLPVWPEEYLLFSQKGGCKQTLI